MKGRIRWLSISTGVTVALLICGALLVAVGIFDDTLDWDIFSPRMEQVLYGIFGSCVAVGAFGAGITVVLGIHELVKSFRQLTRQHESASAIVPDAPRGRYFLFMWNVLLCFGLLIGALSALNHRVKLHRSQVFKKLAREQADRLSPQTAKAIAKLTNPPRDHVPHIFYDVLHTLDAHGFIRRATLYIPDPTDPAAMWGYTAWREYKDKDGFARFFAAKGFEMAMRDAYNGNVTGIQNLNAQKTTFTWYNAVTNLQGKTVGFLRIDANPHENFREYTAF